MKMIGNGLLKKALTLMAVVLFLGQGALSAQNAAEVERLLDRGEYDKAREMIATLKGNDPRNERLDYLQGRAFLETDQLDRAQAAFQAGINHGARFPWNYIGLGTVYAKRGNFASTKENMDKAIEVDRAGKTDVLLGVANGYLQSDKKDFLGQAEIYLNKVLLVEPKNADAYIGLGDLYDRQRVDQLALSNYQQATTIRPDYVKGWLRVGQLLKKQEKYNDAAAAFQKAIDIDPTFPPPYREIAEMWLAAGKFANATENYKKFLELVGDDFAARMRYASILYLSGKYDESLSEFEAIKQDTTSLVMNRLMGYCYVEKGDADAAKKYLDAYFKDQDKEYIIPNDYYYYGRMHLLKGEDSLAILEFEKATILGKEQEKPRPEIWNELADYYKENSNLEKQAWALERYLEEDGEFHLKEVFLLGNTYYRLRDYVNADKAFAMMTEARPELHIGHVWRGRVNAILEKESEEKLAMPHFEKAYELLTVDAATKEKYKADLIQASQYLGAHYTVDAPDFDKAMVYWNTILEVDPENQAAKDAIQYIEQNK